MYQSRNAFLALALALSVHGYSYANSSDSSADVQITADGLRHFESENADMKNAHDSYFKLGIVDGLDTDAAMEFANLSLYKVVVQKTAAERGISRLSEREIGDAYDEWRADSLKRGLGMGVDRLWASASLLFDTKSSKYFHPR